jgi:putative membrane protein
MIGFAATVAGTALALWVTSMVYHPISFGAHPQATTIIVLGALFGVVNGILKPIIKAMSLPLTLLTFGTFGLIVNAALLLGLASVARALELGFTVGGFPPRIGIDALIAAVVGGVILSLVSTVIGFIPYLNPSH